MGGSGGGGTGGGGAGSHPGGRHARARARGARGAAAAAAAAAAPCCACHQSATALQRGSWAPSGANRRARRYAAAGRRRARARGALGGGTAGIAGPSSSDDDDRRMTPSSPPPSLMTTTGGDGRRLQRGHAGCGVSGASPRGAAQGAPAIAGAGRTLRRPRMRPAKKLALGAAAGAAVGGATLLRRNRAVAAVAAERSRRTDAARAARRALAASLADAGRHTLIAFSARDCALCAAMQPTLAGVAEKEAAWLDVVSVDADDGGAWAPETLHYDIQAVPSYILLDDKGRAVAGARGRPADAGAAAAAVDFMVAAARGANKRYR